MSQSVSYIYQLECKIRQLKEELKHYKEPFEMRPTYQILEQKLKKIRIEIHKMSKSKLEYRIGKILDSQEKE